MFVSGTSATSRHPALRPQLRVTKEGEAGEVPTLPGIVSGDEHDRNSRGGRLGRYHRKGIAHNRSHLAADKVSGDVRQLIEPVVRRAAAQPGHGLAIFLDPNEFPKLTQLVVPRSAAVSRLK